MIVTYLMTFFIVFERKSKANCFYEHENDNFLFEIHLTGGSQGGGGYLVYIS